jgi:hypothetical protein
VQRLLDDHGLDAEERGLRPRRLRPHGHAEPSESTWSRCWAGIMRAFEVSRCEQCDAFGD